MHWNPFIELRYDVVRGNRAVCKGCNGPMEKGEPRATAIDVLTREQHLHLDCAAKRAPDVAKRKVLDQDPEWPPEALAELDKRLPPDALPLPRSFQRTPILDLSCEKKELGPPRPCVYCGEQCPEGSDPARAFAVRAFSIDGERRLHPSCVLEIAPGLCKRVVAENSDRWPDELKRWFAEKVPPQVLPTPRSPWRNTGGIPRLEPAPSARAACRYCDQKLEKGQLRLARDQMFGMRRTPVYFHVGCFARSSDWHPRMLELAVLKSAAGFEREQLEALGPQLPAEQPEEPAQPPLLERLLALYALAPRGPQEKEEPKLTENQVVIPEGFFTSS